ncbi:MAG: TlpA disulfide reductase family protein [Desulfobacula sp.]|jgi:hypothetical protein
MRSASRKYWSLILITAVLLAVTWIYFAGPSNSADAVAGGLAGTWLDEEGGQFIIREQGLFFIWMGHGLNQDKYFFHQGKGLILDKSLKGDWTAMAESDIYPGSGTITGQVSADGKSITWQDNAGFYRKWVRELSREARAKALASIEKAFGKPSTGAASQEWGQVSQRYPTAAESRGTGAAGGVNTPQTWSDVDRQMGAQPGTASPQTWGDVNRTIQGTRGPSPDQTADASPSSASRSISQILGISDPEERNAALTELLNHPNAWQDPDVQKRMDQWLSTALPERVAEDPTARYETWGRITGRGITMAGPPDIAEPRYQYLWRNASKFPSMNLCTMRVYVERTLKGESLSDCRRSVDVPKPPPSASDTASTPVRALMNIPDNQWINGKPVLSGRVLVVVFHSPWAAAAGKALTRAETDLALLRKTGWGEKEVHFVAVSDGKREEVVASLVRAGVSFPAALDVEGAVRQAAGAKGSPETFVFDHQGKLLMRLSGYPSDDKAREDLQQTIRSAIHAKLTAKEPRR